MSYTKQYKPTKQRLKSLSTYNYYYVPSYYYYALTLKLAQLLLSAIADYLASYLAYNSAYNSTKSSNIVYSNENSPTRR